MYDVKNLKPVLISCPHLLTIKARTTFAQTFQKIKKTKNPDFVFVEKPDLTQMLATVLVRLTGKRFFWIQGFENPPTPNFATRLLLSQADRILVRDKKYSLKLKKLGVDSSRIRFGKFRTT